MEKYSVILNIIKSAMKEHKLALLSLEQNQNIVIDVSLDVITCLSNGGTVYICGNGGSAADAQHFAAELVGRFMSDRKALSAVALTTDTSIISAIANDFLFSNVFSRQVDAHCTDKDVLIAISTSGESENVIQAILSAKRKNTRTILLSGKNGGRASKIADRSIIIEHTNVASIQEMHSMILHMICGAVDDHF